MRKHELLTEAERVRLLGVPTERDDLARLYTFERRDLDLIRLRREDRNRLGLALQLALFRHPGMTLAQILLRSTSLPEELVSFVAQQLDIPAASFAGYAGREQTMTDHARELAAALGLRGASRTDIPFMIDAAAGAAWDTDRGSAIAAGIIAALRQAKNTPPRDLNHRARRHCGPGAGQETGGSFACRRSSPGATGRARCPSDPPCRQECHPAYVAQDNPDDGKARRRPRHSRSPANGEGNRDSGETDRRRASDRYRQFVREGRASPAYLLERYTTSRRRATLVACLIDLEERLTDAAIALADKLIGNALNRAQNKQSRRYAATAKDVGRLMRLFHGTIDALSTALNNDSDPIEAIEETVGWANLIKARPEVVALAETADVDAHGGGGPLCDTEKLRPRADRSARLQGRTRKRPDDRRHSFASRSQQIGQTGCAARCANALQEGVAQTRDRAGRQDQSPALRDRDARSPAQQAAFRERLGRAIFRLSAFRQLSPAGACRRADRRRTRAANGSRGMAPTTWPRARLAAEEVLRSASNGSSSKACALSRIGCRSRRSRRRSPPKRKRSPIGSMR